MTADEGNAEDNGGDRADDLRDDAADEGDPGRPHLALLLLALEGWRLGGGDRFRRQGAGGSERR